MQIVLFTTCQIDIFRPSVGFAVIELLEQAGYQLTTAAAPHLCCGSSGSYSILQPNCHSNW